MKILRNSKKSVFSLDEQVAFSPKIVRTEKKLAVDQADDTVNLFEIYCDDLNNCTNYRLFFTINPVCSNVLFNALTEITYKEGSSSAVTLEFENVYLPGCNGGVNELELKTGFKPGNSATAITKTQALLDTEYSHKFLGGLEYHCGIDILDNHVLRAKGFASMHPNSSSQFFNTIRATKCSYNGASATFTKSFSTGGIASYIAHVYDTDNFMTFDESLEENLNVRDGWYGFINKSIFSEKNIFASTTSSSSSSKLIQKLRLKAKENGRTIDSISINKCINNDKNCGFIDFYPDRTLFSFLPKINKYRDRAEYNWNYCITYPYESVYTPNSCDTKFDLIKKDYGIKIVWTNTKIRKISSKFNKRIRENSKGTHILNKNDNAYLYCRTAIKHNLKSGDYIELFYWNNAKNVSSIVIMISAIGDERGANQDYYFCMDYDTLSEDFGEYILTETGNIKNNFSSTVMLVPTNLYFKKCVDGLDCDYYFRRFKKIDGIKTTLNKVGFAENAYGDNIAQIVCLDDIDVSALQDENGHFLQDNRGRKLSELYLTVVKNNSGYKEWYIDRNFESDDIEFSHCFGPVTDGLNMEYTQEESVKQMNVDGSEYEIGPMLKDSLRDYNVHCTHNIIKDMILKFGMGIPSPSKKLSKYFISIDNDSFLGDIVEYSPSEDKETVIENVYFRFNTMQREYYFGLDYMNLFYHEIEYDDYDYTNIDEHGFGCTGDSFTVERYCYLTNKNKRANIFPEGYYYKPHYKIKLEEFDDDVSTCYDTRINFQRKYYYSCTAYNSGDNQLCTLSFTGDSETEKYDATEFVFSGITGEKDIEIVVPGVEYDSTTNSLSASFEFQRDSIDNNYLDTLYDYFNAKNPIDLTLRHSAYTYGIIEDTIFYCGEKSGYTEATAEEKSNDDIEKYYYSERKGQFIQSNECGTYVKYGPGEYLSAMTAYNHGLLFSLQSDREALAKNPIFFKMERETDISGKKIYGSVKNQILPDTTFVTGDVIYYRYSPDTNVYIEIDEETAQRMYDKNIICYYSDGKDYVEISQDEYMKYCFEAYVPVRQTKIEDDEDYFVITNVDYIKIQLTKNIELWNYKIAFITQDNITETFDVKQMEPDGIYIEYNSETKINFLETYTVYFVDVEYEEFSYPKDNGIIYQTVYSNDFFFKGLKYEDLYRYDEATETYIQNKPLELYALSDDEESYDLVDTNGSIDNEKTLYYKSGDEYIECTVESLTDDEGNNKDYVFYEPNLDYYPLDGVYTPNVLLYYYDTSDQADFIVDRYKKIDELVIETDTSYDYCSATKISYLIADEEYYSSYAIEYKDGKLYCNIPDGIDRNNYSDISEVFIVNSEAPSYAYYVNDGSGKRIWRGFKNKSDITDESEIYNRMFTNGAFYVNTNINFYVKRQDPLGIYGLQYDKKKNSAMANISIAGKEADTTDTITETNNETKLCKI